MYLKLSSDPQFASMSRFLVWEDPTGTFADSLADVTAQISGPSGLDTVTFKLPEHSDDSPNLALLPIDEAYPVSMGSSSTVTLGVKNNLNGLHTMLSGSNSDIKVTDDDCSTCWAGLTAELKRSRIAPGASASLVLHLQPNTFQILKRNWAPTAPNSNQGHLTVSITTHSAEGGLDIPQDLSVPIRFTPPPLYLVLCLLLGAVVGVLMRALLSDPQKEPFSWRTNAFQFLLALLVWLVVLALSVAKTKLTIFGFELDPTALIPAGIITLLAAAGPAVVKKTSEVFKG